MTFTIKTRGAGGLFMAEYLCPVHGRFELLVERDELGDPPSEAKCPAVGLYRYEDDELDGDEPCERTSPFAVSAPTPLKDSVPCTAVVRGGDMKERPPGMLDTRPLAEGMPLSEWKKVQKKHQEERRHQQLIKKGLKTKRIQSP